MSKPLFMKDASVKFTFGTPGTETEFNCEVHTVEIVATPGDDVTYRTLCPTGTYTQKGASTYVLHLVGVQDWSADGLARMLWDHAGETAGFVAQAHGESVAIGADTPGFEGTIVVVEANYGGEADTWAEIDVELACTTRPTLITAPPVLDEPEAESETGDQIAA